LLILLVLFLMGKI